MQTIRSRSMIAGILIAVLAVVPLGTMASPEAAVEIIDPTVLPLQADSAHPLWNSLRLTGLGPAEWAVLLTSDADGNGQTDFLDLLLPMAAELGQSQTPVELLVYADQVARDAFVQTRNAVEIEGIDAVFLTVPLGEVSNLKGPGVSLIVWEPRVFSTASSNPAGGVPANMPQISIHQGGAAWTAGFDGTGVKIAVLDTGVNPNHDAFQPSGTRIQSWKDCITNGNNVILDNHGHGTHVASIALGSDGTEFRGIAFNSVLVPVKVLDAGGSGSLSSFQCGTTHVRNLKLAGATIVASASLGLAVPPLSLTTLNGGPLDLFGFDAAADILPVAGVPFAVAAGNWLGTLTDVANTDETTQAGVNGVNQVSSPGFSCRVITVGAVSSAQAPATFTALGPGKISGPGCVLADPFKPDVAAHGVSTWGANRLFNDDYIQLSGTSMATPGVAGILALLVDKNPALTPAGYKAALRNGADAAFLVGIGGVKHPVSPNFVSGDGVAKASNSLALV